MVAEVPHTQQNHLDSVEKMLGWSKRSWQWRRFGPRWAARRHGWWPRCSINHIQDKGIRYGLQTICEGGGQANATIVEQLSLETAAQTPAVIVITINRPQARNASTDQRRSRIINSPNPLPL